MHEVFFAQPSSFLAIILQLPILKTWLNSIPSSYPSALASQTRLYLTTTVLYCRTLLYNHFAWTTQRTASVVKVMCLLIHCLARDVVPCEFACVGMCLPSHFLAMGIHVTVFTSCCLVAVDVFCWCAILAFSHYVNMHGLSKKKPNLLNRAPTSQHRRLATVALCSGDLKL
jgi:hypothetical protein